MLDKYDGFKTLYAKLTLTVSDITLEVKPTGKKSGIGVFACEDIPEDTFIMTFAGGGPVIPNTCGFQSHNQFQISRDHSISLTNLAARFINHSCEPNCGHLQGTELYSIARIAQGEELTYDYSCAMARDAERFNCHCGSSQCRGEIGNFADIEDTWRKRVYIRAGIVSPHNLIDPIDLGLTLADAQRGDTVGIRGAAIGAEDIEFKVEKIYRYETPEESWKELGGSARRGWTYLEWHDEDHRFALSRDEDTLSIKDLPISGKDLSRMTSENANDTVIEVQGIRYRFGGSGTVHSVDETSGEEESFRTWDFEREDGRGMISIEKREDEPYEACISTYVNSVDVHIRR